MCFTEQDTPPLVCLFYSLSSEEGVAAVGGEDEIMSWTVETLLERYTQKSSPVVRQAACVWLLSLVKHTNSHPVFKVQTNPAIKISN